MFDSPILEVAVGLSYIFLVLSLVATILVEAIADWRQWRGRMLYAQVCKLLGTTLAYELYSDSKILALASGAPPTSFAIEQLMLPESGTARRGEGESEGGYAAAPKMAAVSWRKQAGAWVGSLRRRLQAWPAQLQGRLYSIFSKLLGSRLGKKFLHIVPEVTAAEATFVAHSINAKRLPSYIPDSTFADVVVGWLRNESDGRLLAPSSASQNGKLLAVSPDLVRLWNEMFQKTAGEAAAMHSALVDWFRSSTDRMGGDYRRRVRYGLLLVGILLVSLSNADAVYISNKLYQDPQLRTQLVEASEQLQARCAADKAKCTGPGDEASMRLKDSINKGLELSREGLLGGNATFLNADGSWSLVSALLHLFGWLLTILAIGLGTDFWFGAIQKLLSIGNAKQLALAQEGGQAADAPISTSAGPSQSQPLPVGPLSLTGPAAKGMKGFSGRLFRESPLNAFWLAQLASMAYSNPSTFKGAALLTHLGLAPSPIFISNGTTQAYLFEHSDALIVAFRGTEQAVEDFLADADFRLEKSGQDWPVVPAGVELHAGFVGSLDLIWAEMSNLLRGSEKPIWFTGHSLGGALAVLAAYRYHLETGDKPAEYSEIGGIYTFGQPRIGNMEFKDNFPARLTERMYRYVNDTDVVPQVPPPQFKALRYEHVGQLRYFDTIGELHTHPDIWDRVAAMAGKLLAEVDQSHPETWKAAAIYELKSPLANHAIARYLHALERLPLVRAQWAARGTG